VITVFPSFRPLRADDRNFVESFTRHLAPYSDFNFTSLWCWDVSGQVRISSLEGALVVRFSDYLTGLPFYSFCGGSAPASVARKVCEHAATEGIASILRLLPEETASELEADFEVAEDPGNFDYILCASAMSSYRGASLHGQRNYVNRFTREYNAAARRLDLTDHSSLRAIERLLDKWARDKQLLPAEIHNEFAALRRLFDYASGVPLIALGVFQGSQLLGFSISEVVAEPYAMLHFQKGDRAFVGIYPFIIQETARCLAALGCRLLNYQQELGLPALRQGKRSYKPLGFLKKFSATPT